MKIIYSVSPSRPMLLLLTLFLLVSIVYNVIEGNYEQKSFYPEHLVAENVVFRGDLCIDTSNAANGYFFAAVCWPKENKIKLKVIHNTNEYVYNLNEVGNFEIFPFQSGSGHYIIELYENVSFKKYTFAGAYETDVILSDENISFLYPNQMVNYKETDRIIEKANALLKETPQKTYNNIKKYVETNFFYDYIKAINTKSGDLPDINSLFETHFGICQDIAAATVAMLRSQGIPARMVVGKANSHKWKKQPHAWIEVLIDDEWIFYDPTAAINNDHFTEYYPERYY